VGQRYYHLSFGKKGDTLFNGAAWVQVVINERAGKEVRQYFFDANSAVAFVRTNCETDVEKEALGAERAKTAIIAQCKPGQESRLEKIEADLVERVRQIDTDKSVLVQRIEAHFQVRS
jgi:hypothetical protein